jgi:hypothetical protein
VPLLSFYDGREVYELKSGFEVVTWAKPIGPVPLGLTHRFFCGLQKAMLGVEIWRPKQGEAAVRDRLSPRHRGLAGLVIAMALCGAASAAPSHAKKGHAHKPLMQQPAPPVHYIHCVMGLGEGPCGPDPAMRRLNGEPPLIVSPDPSFDQPDLAPGR